MSVDDNVWGETERDMSNYEPVILSAAKNLSLG
jgi:hypothetical protein